MRILAIVTHPDDELLGMGGTLIKHISQGDEVYVCIITRASEIKCSKEEVEKKKREADEVSKFLNIKKLFRLDFPSLRLHTVPIDEIITSISKIIGEIKPEVVYTNFKGDLNIDHRIVFQATCVAARPFSEVKKMLAAETPSETDLAPPFPEFAFQPNFYVDISKEIDKKIDALRIYKSEIKPFPHPRSIEAVKALAIKRGAESNLKSAEAFVIVREIV